MQSTRTNLIHSFKTHCFDCVKQSCRLRVIFYLREFCSLDTNSIKSLMSRFNQCHKNVWIYYYYYLKLLMNNDLKRKQKCLMNKNHLFSAIITSENTIMNHLIKKSRSNELKLTLIMSLLMSFSVENFISEVNALQILKRI